MICAFLWDDVKARRYHARLRICLTQLRPHKLRPDGSYELLFSDETLIWPDSLSIGPDNTIYAAINQLNRAADLNGGEDISEPPFKVIRFPALTEASVGR